MAKKTKSKKALKEASVDAIDRKQEMLNAEANFKKRKNIKAERKAKMLLASQEITVRVNGKTKKRG